MELAEKSLNNSVLRGFVPLDALSDSHLHELAKNAAIEEIAAGDFVFKAGDRDDQTIYLLAGVVEFSDSNGKAASKLSVKSKASKHPLAHTQPRQLSVRAVEKATVVKIASSRLDALLAWSESTGYNVEEIAANHDDDWLTRLLQSETFSRLSPVNIQQLLSSMESMPVSAGEVVVEEGSAGETFYVVKQGRLSVTRQGAVEDKAVLLAELSDGACFGEDALVAGTQRNATVTMLTDGVLMRVSKQDFDELLRVPLVQSIDYALASQAVEQGALWLDVRLVDEYQNCALPSSLNLPLSELRGRLDELDQHRRYITCCDTGRRSATAAFILTQHGFDATALQSGMLEVPWEDLAESAPEDTQGDRQDVGTEPVSVAESAAHAAIISDYQAKIDQAEAEKNRLTSELESARLELRHQTDEMAKVLQESQDSASSLDTAREALARTQNEQQNTLNQQTRLTHRLRTLEKENTQLRQDYEFALAKNGDTPAGIEAQASLAQELADARQQLEQATAEESQIKTAHHQVVKEREKRIKSLEVSLESEREAVQQQIDELTTSVKADIQASIATQHDAENEKDQELSALRSQLDQVASERDTHQTDSQQARQEADQLRAELEVSRGLEAMEPVSAESEMQEAITQLKTELDAETAQRVFAEQEITRWKTEAAGLEQAIQEASETEITVTPVMYTSPPDNDREAAQLADVAENTRTGSDKKMIAGELIEDDDLVSDAGFGGKWKLFLAIGAIAGAAILYWLPDFGKQAAIPVEPKAVSTFVKDSDSKKIDSSSQAVPVKPSGNSAEQLDPVTVENENLTATVAEAVAAIEAIEATSRVQTETPVAGKAADTEQPARKMTPGKLFRDVMDNGGRGPSMVRIPAGSFTMGSSVTSANFGERPQHEVAVSAFAIGNYEVTFADYDLFARASNRAFPADAGWGRGRQPVINISWNDATAYARWLSEQTGFNYRLPTEAEWEYAARAGTVTRYWWGNEPVAVGNANCFDCGSKWDGVKPAPAGSLPANSVGVYEIAGNVMEWVQDCFLPDYQVASTVGAAVNLTPCDAHVVRGGSYSSPSDTLRSAARSRRVPQSRIDNLGFRVVRGN